MEFKQQITDDFIPRIKEMIEKEEKHIETLKEYKVKCMKPYKVFGFIPINVGQYDDINEMISESTKILSHLKLRLHEYEEYSETL